MLNWSSQDSSESSSPNLRRRVILPQALPEMVPPFGNLWIQILKSSSLLYLIGITELTFEVKQLQFDMGSMAAFSIALVVYFLLAQILVAVTRWVEARTAARVGRGPKANATKRPGRVATT